MKGSFADTVLSIFGKLYLYLRLRKTEQVQQELERRYEGQFRNAGLVLLFDLLMALAVVVFVAVFAGLLYFITV
ncbi:hypothetical protein CLV24_106125 [Pontibacter ummariensis]|uniref:Uncharacterized protein n=1 Tax=Pontibacter ummariensis TaxID=1610492 RepID=A0A239EEZ5_9BACT|nr:hypothetical protein [Pontibacter ummariensis]PRY13210.1 hypothetical protein CLV24_106125 [Pontibacter ummariensis]SNS42848.1 hypothetical protein SAMN06296052_106125 [Pontibacter ummariensis]